MTSNNLKITLKDNVYRQVIEMICNGQLQNDDIITEKQLTSHFGISKSPVREALIQLCHDHVLKSIPRCGYQVVTINAKDIHNLTETRLLLELGSLPKIIERITPEQLSELKELNRQREKPLIEKDVWSSWNRNIEFHLSLVEIANNEYILETMERVLSSCTRAYAQLYSIEKQAVILPGDDTHAHSLITQAIEAGNLEAAQSLLRMDILCMESQLLSIHIK
ncbi:GntR family transcriptional regulator [Enterocloster sp.]|uniref:GntR family transcriptional regulator n=1 Tax=Enterocloster sp. TaxID=2719315 RepID=UPI003AB55D33